MGSASLIAPLAAALAVPAMAQTPTLPAVTRDQAMTLPPNELAEIVLRQLGARVTSVTRPNFAPSSDMRMVGALQDLTFATAPQASDVAGLCAANVIRVRFERPGVGNNRDETPVRALEVTAEQVYKVIGENEPFDAVSETRRAEEDRRCAEAGPVIQANYSDRGRPLFFGFEGALPPATALLALRRAIGEARAGHYREISCAAEAPECRDPTALLGSLDLARLGRVNVTYAGLGDDFYKYRIEASFLIHADEHEERYWIFTMEAEIDQLSIRADPIRRLGPSRFGRTWTIEN